ncbi:hypothetical protein [Microbacterium sp. USHLN186]|uniref:hypothetical protein n=1 Tax=Microbacterium sp. USHLN186 TaxID=3081286 RepID=UPI003015AEB5
MTRIDQLAFSRPLALYRGTGDGVAVVSLSGDLPAWARVDRSGAGIASGYVYLIAHAGEIQVYGVSGSAHSGPPERTDEDPRLTPLGACFSASDAASAMAEDTALAARTRASMELIRERSFMAHAETPWGPATVRVGPTHAGETILECHLAHGDLKLLSTIVPRHTLEGALVAPVTITVGYRTPHRLWGGMAARTAKVTLSAPRSGG